jgi:hypothetical protein
MTAPEFIMHRMPSPWKCPSRLCHNSDSVLLVVTALTSPDSKTTCPCKRYNPRPFSHEAKATNSLVLRSLI